MPIKTEFVSLEELKKRATWVPEHLPKDKPLRIMQIGDFSVIPDGGTQIKNTGEVLEITEVTIEKEDKFVFVFYKIIVTPETIKYDQTKVQSGNASRMDSNEILNVKNQYLSQITSAKNNAELEQIRIDLFGRNGKITELVKRIKDVPQEDRQQIGILLNDTKNTLESLITEQKKSFKENAREWFDPTIPGIKPRIGHMHLLTQGISEIAKVFEGIGFERVRYPEVEWDWFAFEALNFPENHPARDDWETFFVDAPISPKYGPHDSYTPYQ